MTHPAIFGTFLALTLTVTACCANKQDANNGSQPAPAFPRPATLSYADTRDTYNARIDRLNTLNASGIIVFQYTNDDGELTKDQGDLNLRVQRPHNLALVIKKLGETYIWLGADRSRYWLINLLNEPSTAVLGEHDRITTEKADALTLPVPPRDLLHLIALEPVPPDGMIGWDQSTGSKVMRFEANRPSGDPNADNTAWQITLDPDTQLPSSIALIDLDTNTTIIASTLHSPRAVRTVGPVQPNQPPDPTTPTHITISRPATDEFVRLVMERLNNRPSNPTLFDLQARLDTLQPQRLIDIDD